MAARSPPPRAPSSAAPARWPPTSPATCIPRRASLERDLVFETPWGDSPPFTLFELGGHTALHVRLHGWRKGVSRGRASRQVFSVLHRAGVKRILSDAGVGSLNHLLDPGDLVVVDDFVDQTTDRDRYGVVVGDHLLIMRDPVCAAGREALVGCRPAPRPRAPRVHARHLRGHRGAALRVARRGPSPADAWATSSGRASARRSGWPATSAPATRASTSSSTTARASCRSGSTTCWRRSSTTTPASWAASCSTRWPRSRTTTTAAAGSCASPRCWVALPSGRSLPASGGSATVLIAAVARQAYFASVPASTRPSCTAR